MTHQRQESVPSHTPPSPSSRPYSHKISLFHPLLHLSSICYLSSPFYLWEEQLVVCSLPNNKHPPAHFCHSYGKKISLIIWQTSGACVGAVCLLLSSPWDRCPLGMVEKLGGLGGKLRRTFSCLHMFLCVENWISKGRTPLTRVGLKEAWNFKEEKTGGRKLLPLELLSSLFLHEWVNTYIESHRHAISFRR